MPSAVRNWLGPLVAVLIPLAVNVRAVLGLARFTFDYDGYHFPLASTLYQGFPALVTWDRYSYGGIALSSNLQTAASHPSQLLVFAVSKLTGAAELSEYAFGWVNLLNLVLLALGAYLLGRRLTGSVIAGLLGAAVVSVLGTVLSQAQHMGVIGSLAPLPIVVLCLLEIGEATRRRSLLLGTLGMAAGLGYSLSAGFIPQFVAIGLTLAVVTAALAIAQPGAALRRFAALVVAAVGAALLNAGALASFLLTSGQTLQLGVHAPIAGAQLLTLVIPGAFGLRDWPDTEWAVDPTTHYAWGGVAFLAVLIAFIATRPPRRELAVVVASVLLVAVAVTPLITSLGALGGLFEVIRPFLVLAPATIVVATVAAPIAWQRRAQLRRVPRAVFVGVVASHVVLLAIVLVVNPSLGGFGYLDFAVWLVLTLVVVVALLLPARFARAAAAALVLAVVVEGGIVVASARFIQPPIESPPSLAPFADDELLRVLRSRPGLVAADNEVLGGPLNGWWSVWRVRSVNGFQPTYPERWDEAAEAASDWRDDRRFSFDLFATGRPQELSVATFATTSERALEILTDLDGSRLLWDKHGIAFVSIPGALPSALLDVGSEREELDLMWRSDSVATATMKCPVGEGTVSLVGVFDDRWTATLDGRDLGVGRPDGGRTEWDVSGCGELRWEFIDRPYLAGLLVSLITGLSALGFAIILLRRRDAPATEAEVPATAPTAS